MISISAKTFDIDGVLAINPISDGVDRPITRRVARVATLDQGVAVSDRGFSHGDRTLIVRYRPVSAAHDNTARRLISVHSRVNVFMDEGVFEAVISSLDQTGPENTITLYLLEKLSED